MDINNSLAHEEEYVHQVYEQIASHFSATRYKPWPIVEKFLKELPAGSVGLDIGCGNGKYMSINPDIHIIGSDRSTNLVDIARQSSPKQEAVVADSLSLPHPLHSFDFAISIAVVHHFSSAERRTAAISSILSMLKSHPSSRALIYVWALEQKNSRRGWDEGGEQDVFVPWVLTPKKTSKKKHANYAEATDEYKQKTKQEPPTFQRYYHLYRSGELEASVIDAGGDVVEAGYEKDNWWAIISGQKK